MYVRSRLYEHGHYEMRVNLDLYEYTPELNVENIYLNMDKFHFNLAFMISLICVSYQDLAMVIRSLQI